MSLGAGGLEMQARKRKADPRGSQIDSIEIAGETIGIPLSRRARLMGASALASGAMRGLAAAAGLAAVFGASPALAQCASGTSNARASRQAHQYRMRAPQVSGRPPSTGMMQPLE